MKKGYICKQCKKVVIDDNHHKSIVVFDVYGGADSTGSVFCGEECADEYYKKK